MTVFAVRKLMKCQPKCMFCCKVFKTWTELTKHSKDEHEQQKELECTTCGKKQTTASGHRKHMISHEEENLNAKSVRKKIAFNC